MFKKPRLTFAIIGGLSTGVIIAVILFYTVIKTDSTESPQPETQNQEEPTPTPVVPSASKESYADEAGFTFSYPSDVVVEKKDLAKADYSRLQMTSSRAKGSIDIQASDTTEKTVDAWLKENKAEATESASTPVKLGHVDAKELKSDDSLSLVALEKGVVFTITAQSDTDFAYWEKVYRVIVDSFTFTLPEEDTSAAPAPAQDTSGGIMFEGEEVIE